MQLAVVEKFQSAMIPLKISPSDSSLPSQSSEASLFQGQHIVATEQESPRFNHLHHQPPHPNTQRIDLACKDLLAVPETLLQYSESLRWLDLSGNNLLSLPEFFDQLPALKSLIVAHNKLTKLP